MIAAWMLYTVSVTLLLFAGASAADYLARALRVPSRFVWAAGILVALGLSGRALTRGTQPRHDVLASPVAGGTGFSQTLVNVAIPSADGQSTPVSRADTRQSFLMAVRGAVGGLGRTLGRVDLVAFDVARFERWNISLVALWIAASGIAFIWLAGSLVRLWLIERELATKLVDVRPVLVSRDVGPAVFGVVRSRIVVPRWVLSLPRSERHLILAHEGQHAAAFDPALLYAAAVALALQPWNVVLWALFARLRFAIEADCDRRVLDTTGDARRYGKLLVTVYERTAPSFTPSVAFVERPSDLERRIRRMTRRPRLLSMASAGAVLAMLVLSTAAWTMSAPVRYAVSETLMAGPRARQLPEVITTGERAGPTPPPPKMGLITVIGVAPSTTIPSLELTPSSETRLSAVQGSATHPRAVGRERLCRFGPTDNSTRPLVMRASVDVRDATVTVDSLCMVDGEIIMLALDSSRVLAAWRDTADAGIQNTTYLILTSVTPSIPSNLAWSTAAGHAEFSGPHFYFASPAPGIPAVVFGSPANTSRDREPGVLRITIQRIDMQRQPSVTWDVLRQLPSSPRCIEPLIVIDGIPQASSHVERDHACFVVGGQMIRLLR